MFSLCFSFSTTGLLMLFERILLFFFYNSLLMAFERILLMIFETLKTLLTNFRRDKWKPLFNIWNLFCVHFCLETRKCSNAFSNAFQSMLHELLMCLPLFLLHSTAKFSLCIFLESVIRVLHFTLHAFFLLGIKFIYYYNLIQVDPSYRPSLVSKDANGSSVIPFASSDLILSPSQWSSHVVGMSHFTFLFWLLNELFLVQGFEFFYNHKFVGAFQNVLYYLHMLKILKTKDWSSRIEN